MHAWSTMHVGDETASASAPGTSVRAWCSMIALLLFLWWGWREEKETKKPSRAPKKRVILYNVTTLHGMACFVTYSAIADVGAKQIGTIRAARCEVTVTCGTHIKKAALIAPRAPNVLCYESS